MRAGPDDARAFPRIAPHLASLAKEIDAAPRPGEPARALVKGPRAADALLKRIEDRLEAD